MLCPVDKSELLIDSVGGYQVHRCTQCSGVAFGGNLWRDVRAYVALELHKKRDDTAGVGACPIDSKAMLALVYKGISMFQRNPAFHFLSISAGNYSHAVFF
jgi:hypothetical protein